MKIKSIPFLYIFLLISILSLILTFILIGTSTYLFLLLILWSLIYLIHFTKILNISFLKGISVWILIIVIIVINILFVTVLKPNKNSATVQPLTPEQCAPIYDEFNNTIVDISSDGLKGTVGIKINSEDCKADVYYNFMLTAQLDKNTQLEGVNYKQYKYVGGLRSPDEERKLNSGSAEILPVYKSSDTLPNEFDFGTQNVEYNTFEEINGLNTSTFYHGWKSMYNFRDDSLEKILSKTTYQIMDASDYIVTETENEVTSQSVDASSASKNGPIVKTYELKYSVR